MVGEVGFDRGIMEIFQRYKISYIMKSTNANSITQVILEEDVNDKLIGELKKNYHEITVMPVALVCALGTNITSPGILVKATQALAENNINI